MAVAVSAGFFDPAGTDRAVADGKADFIGMARSWISNVDYGRKVLEGKDEEIVPCIRCNKCHVSNGKDMWRSVCSVNPRLGFEDKLERMIVPVRHLLNVAVVGGGPAGMEFAAEAAGRGHEVTLYESSGELGGQLCHANYPSFKWPLRQFKEFLIRRQEECGVRSLLNTRATPEMLKAEDFDVIAVAVGAEPSMLPVPGADGQNVFFASEIYGSSEDRLGDSVIVIGGGEIGVETALYLCELGKKVMVLEMLPELIGDAPHAHYKNMVRAYWQKQPNFRYKCGVACTMIDADGVRYLTREGKEETSFGESVLIATGTRPRVKRVMSFAGCAPRVFAIGDCDEAGNVQKALRSAYGMAMSL
jgi:NADPH-dependent 2,4-dienoyl-CoA reductase/sulfur reductase-like enzyme